MTSEDGCICGCALFLVFILFPLGGYVSYQMGGDDGLVAFMVGSMFVTVFGGSAR